jgi:hypothetical protein
MKGETKGNLERTIGADGLRQDDGRSGGIVYREADTSLL